MKQERLAEEEERNKCGLKLANERESNIHVQARFGGI